MSILQTLQGHWFHQHFVWYSNFKVSKHFMWHCMSALEKNCQIHDIVHEKLRKAGQNTEYCTARSKIRSVYQISSALKHVDDEHAMLIGLRWRRICSMTADQTTIFVRWGGITVWYHHWHGVQATQNVIILIIVIRRQIFMIASLSFEAW